MSKNMIFPIFRSEIFDKIFHRHLKSDFQKSFFDDFGNQNLLKSNLLIYEEIDIYWSNADFHRQIS